VYLLHASSVAKFAVDIPECNMVAISALFENAFCFSFRDAELTGALLSMK